MRASVCGAAPLTAGLPLVPGGGTIHSSLDGRWSSAVHGEARRLGAPAPTGAATERLTTTPGPPVASTSAE